MSVRAYICDMKAIELVLHVTNQVVPNQ